MPIMRLLWHTLRARDALDARIAADGLLERAGDALEDGLDEVVRLVGGEDLDGEGESGLLSEAAQELDGELRGEIAGLEPVQVHALGQAKDEQRTAAEIERD